METATDIQQIEQRMADVRDGLDERVQPGRPERFTEACQAGDAIRQGDLYLVITDAIPEGFIQVDDSDENKQLVPGNTIGAKHCLDSLEGVEQWRPKRSDNESTTGPVLKLSADRVVLHPTHGHVTLLAGTMVACHYQREFDFQRKREMRAID